MFKNALRHVTNDVYYNIRSHGVSEIKVRPMLRAQVIAVLVCYKIL